MKGSNMSTLNKSLAALLIVAAASVSGIKYLEYRETQPYLKGHCFLLKEDGSYVMFADVVKGLDDKGEEKKAYGAIIMVAPFELPITLDITKANKLIKDLQKSDKITEVNCENGSPLDK